LVEVSASFVCMYVCVCVCVCEVRGRELVRRVVGML